MTRAVAAAFLAGFALTAIGDAPAQVSPFVGARAGMMLFDSTVQAGPIKLVDQGGDAPAYALFGGADYRFGNGLFLGAEALLGTSAGRSRLVMNGVDYTMSIPVYAEAALRAGWRMRSGAAFYLRAGGMFADVQEGPRGGWRASPLVGIGAEIPFHGGWFARLDASWSDLAGLEVWQAGAGVGWRW